MNKVIESFFSGYIGDIYIPQIRLMDIVEILIIALLLYKIMLWIKNTKAWMLLRGMIVLGAFILLAALLRMDTILFLVRNSIRALAIMAVVAFQPELRRALEKLGEKNFLSKINPFVRRREEERFSEETLKAIVKACFLMGESYTGALIVVEQSIELNEYAMTGIQLDCLVSTQVILNIFDHHTPLHDGAVIVRSDRIIAATCYLPLSDNMEISKELGTRHRAALGMSEVSDALMIVVSEETGQVSTAMGGILQRELTQEELIDKLKSLQTRTKKSKRIRLWRGRHEQRNGHEKV